VYSVLSRSVYITKPFTTPVVSSMHGDFYAIPQLFSPVLIAVLPERDDEFFG
jgi:hypothetical protein